jgi:ketosteroid isomerase-like protein
MNKVELDVWEVILSINRIWTKTKETNELVKYFHKDMVALVGPDKTVITGVTACVDHWHKCSLKKIISWQEKNERISIFGDSFATVVYNFDITLEREGKIVEASLADTFTLVKGDGTWKVVSAVV